MSKLIRLAPRKDMKVSKGHSYGKGRETVVMRDKRNRRSRDKLRHETRGEGW